MVVPMQSVVSGLGLPKFRVDPDTQRRGKHGGTRKSSLRVLTLTGVCLLDGGFYMLRFCIYVLVVEKTRSACL